MKTKEKNYFPIISKVLFAITVVLGIIYFFVLKEGHKETFGDILLAIVIANFVSGIVYNFWPVLFKSKAKEL